MTTLESQVKEAHAKIESLERQRIKESAREERELADRSTKFGEDELVRVELVKVQKEISQLSEDKLELEQRYRGNRQAGKSIAAECERLKLSITGLEREIDLEKLTRQEELVKERARRTAVQQELEQVRREEQSNGNGMEMVREELSRTYISFFDR